MRYVGLFGKIILILTFGLGLLLATADDRELASLDFFHPATLLRFVTSKVSALESYAREMRARHARAATRPGERIQSDRAPSPPGP